MQKFLQIKFAATVGNADLPPNYPADCMETDDSKLLPGFDAVMTHEELLKAQGDLSTDYEALESVRIEREKAGIIPSPVDRVDDDNLKIILSLKNDILKLQGKPVLANVDDLKVELKKTVEADVAAEAQIEAAP